jgi:hypothetical protein
MQLVCDARHMDKWYTASLRNQALSYNLGAMKRLAGVSPKK